MDAPVDGDRQAFGNFRLDIQTGRLCRRDVAGDWEQVPIGTRALDILRVLLKSPGAVVSKDAIMDAVWPGTAVEPSNLTVQIAALRRVLDEGHNEESCIQTITGRGYQFVLNVVAREAEARFEPATPHIPRPAVRSLRGKTEAVIACAVVLVASLAILGWWMLRDRTVPPPGPTATSTRTLDRRQSAIVLPFENSSGDPAQDDLAAGLTRDLTDRIAFGRDGPVVPAVTASAYRGKSVDLQAIGHKYDVHFALVGSVRRQAGRMIVSASVYDVAEGQPLWSHQFDLPDGPGALTPVVQRIYESYWQTSVDVEANRAMHDHPDRLDKRDLLHVALSTRLATPTKGHYLEKMSLVDRVLAIDPNDRYGLERQARLHADFVLVGYSSDPAADLALAETASDRLFAIDPNNLNALRARASVLRARGDWPAAEAVVRRAMGLQPTEAMRHYELGFILMAEGRHQEALQSFQNASRFAGGSDPVYLFDANIAMANLAIGQLVEAIATAKLSISEFPPDTGRSVELPWLALIAATSDNGQDNEARANLQGFLATSRSWHSMSQIQQWPAFVANRNLLDGLRNAGMPAE
jgi:DNA-binding winged helix-turn-helix (wHTH) protein/TolB-like protein